jgi:LPXTG-site transpeptidase (sortase) family protein
MQSSRRLRSGINVVRWLAVAAVALALLASIAPATTSPAGATICPEGYELGPDKEVVNSDGSVTRTPGDCIPKKTLNMQGGLLGNLGTNQSPQVDLDQAQDVEIGPLLETPTPTPEGGNGESGNGGISLGNVTAQEVPNLEVTGTGYLTIHKYHCEGAVDWASESLEGLRSDCSALPDIQFDLSNVIADGSKNFQQIATSDVDGLAIWQIPNPATIVVDEVMPEGYVDPIVYCGVVAGPGGGLGQLSWVDAAGGVITQSLQNDQQMYCDWFNLAGTAVAEDEDGSTVTVLKLVCPAEIADDPQSIIADATVQGGLNLGPRTDGPPTDAPELCTEFEAELGVGYTFNVTVDGQDLGDKLTGLQGLAEWTGVPAGNLVITEQIPDGYGEPFFYCHAGRAPIVNEFTGTAAFPFPGGDITCVVVNVPIGDVDDGEVVVHKWECDEDPGWAEPMADDLSAQGCELVTEDIKFTLYYGIDTAIEKFTNDAGPGTVQWKGVPAGELSIVEEVPSGYGQPVVYCTYSLPEGNENALQSVTNVSGAEGSFELQQGQKLRCHWINIPEEDSSITIYKYTCPEGYDLYADGANPASDCTELTNGIVFTATGDSFSDPAVTGDYAPGDGVALWSFLEPGSYHIEETPPAGTSYAFVLSCEGSSVPMIQNYPLAYGFDLDIEIASGDHVVCYWYNVPEPEWGTMTVIKYACATEHFVSPDECEIYEGGVQFQLFHWTGAEGYVAGEGTTNASGVLSWTGLANGSYELNEIDREWCYAEASRSDANGYIEVVAGEETTVWVYNCGVTTPLKQPAKYPNTGAGGAVIAADVSAAPVESQGAYLALPHNRLTGVLDSRIASSMIAGDRPVQIAFDSIGLNAEIEVLEIVDGAFEDPTTSDKVAWYKDTATPGESGNVMMAGHLNYWGDPEGVFFALAGVQEGEVIEVTLQDGTTYRYQVVSVEQVEANAETLETVAAQTGEQTLTLITCGGQWDPGIQSYLHRTVVKAVQID